MRLRGNKIKIILAAVLVLATALAVLLIWNPAGSLAGDAERKAKVESMYKDYKDDFPGVTDISPEDALTLWRQGKAQFVDIREPREQAVSMLPGALTQAQFEQKAHTLQDKTIITYCTISYRSGKYTESKSIPGLKIINLRGGILGWVHAGGPVFQNGKEVRIVHVFGSRWDLAPSGIESTY
jgi:rhodanese-related sulfurtransferase